MKTGDVSTLLNRNKMTARRDAMKPKLISSDPSAHNRKMAAEVLPKGSTLSPSIHKSGVNGPWGGQATMSTGGGASQFHTQRPLMPEYDCFIEGTLVNLPNGESKKIEDIVIGDKVVDRKGMVQTVERQWSSGTPDTLVEITTLSGLKFKTTDRHNWPVWAWARKCQCGCGEDVKTLGKLYLRDHYKTGMATGGVSIVGDPKNPMSNRKLLPEGYDPIKKMRADEIRKGDFLMMPRSFEKIKTATSLDKARLLGYYIAEGNIDYHRTGEIYSATWTFGIHEEYTFAKDVHDILESMGIASSVVSVKKNKNVCRVRLTNDRGKNRKTVDELIEWLAANGGQIAAHKKWSTEVLGWSLDLKLEMLKGMIRGDGCQQWRSTKGDKGGNSFIVLYTTVSKTLAHQVQLGLTQLGFPSCISTWHSEKRIMNGGKLVSCAERYDVRVISAYSKALADIIWGSASKSAELESKNAIRATCMMDDDFVYYPVKAVNIVDNDRPVYNLTVSGDHSYLVSNIATYNSPDRQFYPEDRLQANAYWRMFHKYDPIFGTAIDMYASMMTSDFDIVLSNEEDSSIKNQLMDMCDQVNFLEKFQQLIKEYLVIGESFPHNFFDSERGIWNYIAFHNPDYIEVQDSPIIDMEPIINFLPDDQLRELISSNTPESHEIRKKLPSEFVSKVLARQKIRLSPLNCSFVARKLHAYDERGTSLASRLWRIFAVEDAVYSSTLAHFRRASSPLKVLKLGDPSTGWIPSPDTEQELLRMVTAAELDPQCFVPETPITQSDGITKCIGDLELGDELLDKNGLKCTVEALQDEYTTELVNLRVEGSPDDLICTTTHKWSIWGIDREYTGVRSNLRVNSIRSYMEKRGLSLIQKVTADKIKSGDYLMVPRSFESFSPSDFNKDKARLLGYYAAEGSVSDVKGTSRKEGRFSLSIKERSTLAVDICNIVYDICGKRPKIYDRPQTNSCEVALSNLAFAELLDWLELHVGRGSHTKVLSPVLMGLPLEYKKEFIKGYLLGDGCSHDESKKRGNRGSVHVDVVSASRKMIEQVKLIFAQLGYYAGYCKTAVSLTSLFGAGNPIFTLRISGRKACDLAYEVWGRNHTYAKRDCTHWWVDDDFIYVRIKSVKNVDCSDEPQKVINMTVSGDHSYLANHFGTYNSWIVYNYGVNFEQWGNGERAVTLSRENDTIEKVKLLALGMSKSFVGGEVTYSCSTPDTKVLKASGQYLNIDEIKVGDKVVDRFGNPQEVTNFFEYHSPDKLIKITTCNNKELLLTDNHNLPIMRGSGDILKLQSKDVEVGDYLMMPRCLVKSLSEEDMGKCTLTLYENSVCSTKVESESLALHSESLLTQAGYASFTEKVGDTYYVYRDDDAPHIIKDDDYLYLPVKSVEVIDTDKEKYPYVYSLTVANTNSYTLNNLASYNSAKSGLQVFLRRLLNMRQFFESSWIMPKFFQPIIEINDWQKGTPAEVNHRIKIKRTAQEADALGLLIKPKLIWRNKLDPKVDSETLQAYLQLKNLGFIVSPDSVGAAVSLDWRDELAKDAKAFKEREEILTKQLGPELKSKYDAKNQEGAGAKPPGAAGSGAAPPGAAGGKKPPGGQPGVSSPPGSSPEESGSGPSDESIDSPGSMGGM